MSVSKNNISVAIITFNEEKNIERALKSVAWANEIIVLDSGSTDNTLKILDENKIKWFHRDFDNFSKQKNHVLSLCNNDWVLVLDADEQIPDDLGKELQQLDLSATDLAAYSISRKNYFMGKWVRFSGWQNDHVTRLINRNECKYNNNLVHEDIVTSGRIKNLNGTMLHYTYKDLSSYIRKVDVYSSLKAQQKIESGKKPHFALVVIKPLIRFINCYFIKLGILDGKVGFIISMMSSYVSFLQHVKMIQMYKGEKYVHPRT